MLNYIIIVALVALGASWVLNIGYKWGIIDYWKVNTHFDLLNKMLNCNFCISFWTCMAISIVVAMLMNDMRILFVPIFSTNITKNII